MWIKKVLSVGISCCTMTMVVLLAIAAELLWSAVTGVWNAANWLLRILNG